MVSTKICPVCKQSSTFIVDVIYPMHVNIIDGQAVFGTTAGEPHTSDMYTCPNCQSISTQGALLTAIECSECKNTFMDTDITEHNGLHLCKACYEKVAGPVPPNFAAMSEEELRNWAITQWQEQNAISFSTPDMTTVLKDAASEEYAPVSILPPQEPEQEYSTPHISEAIADMAVEVGNIPANFPDSTEPNAEPILEPTAPITVAPAVIITNSEQVAVDECPIAPAEPEIFNTSTGPAEAKFTEPLIPGFQIDTEGFPFEPTYDIPANVIAANQAISNTLDAMNIEPTEGADE